MEEKEIIEDCFISKQTWVFLALILSWYNFYGKVSDALIGMYGEEQAEGIIKNRFDEKGKEIEAILYGFVNDSIRENITIINFNKI